MSRTGFKFNGSDTMCSGNIFYNSDHNLLCSTEINMHKCEIRIEKLCSPDAVVT